MRIMCVTQSAGCGKCELVIELVDGDGAGQRCKDDVEQSLARDRGCGFLVAAVLAPPGPKPRGLLSK